MIDGELVIRDADGNPVFDSLQMRLHPAESRIKLLSGEIPANYIAFDLLAEGDENLGDWYWVSETAGSVLTEGLERALQVETG